MAKSVPLNVPSVMKLWLAKQLVHVQMVNWKDHIVCVPSVAQKHTNILMDSDSYDLSLIELVLYRLYSMA